MNSKCAGVLLGVLLSIVLIGCDDHDTTGVKTEQSEVTTITLDDSQILVNGKEASSDESGAVYIAHDIVFYLEGQDFTYGEGSKEDEHSQMEADAHTVVHITQPGTYALGGKLSAGQIAVDLGDGAKKDESAVVTLILNNVDISCSVAPGIIFYNVYECGSDKVDDADKDVDTRNAGANIVIADGSVNQINGSYVARIYESIELNEAGTKVVDSKKLHKYDAALHSRRSLNIAGETDNTGVLNIMAENEGIASELHLTINGGNINIISGNDGINSNEDEVSVITVNGGNLNIIVDGAMGEGDGIDSNGWLVINGGNIMAAACSFSKDSGIDSDRGIHINGGTVLATGNMLDRIEDSEQNYKIFTFDEAQKAGAFYEIKNEEDTVMGSFTPVNDFHVLVYSTETMAEGEYTVWKDGVPLPVQELKAQKME